MMKKVFIPFFSLAFVAVTSCDDVKRTPGSTYMPDMGTSRAYETYADHSNLASKGIKYNNLPVAGTVSRGEEMPYHLKNDSAGYTSSSSVKSPLQKLSSGDMLEAERLYLINCAICHGTKMDGNGPLYKDGAGPYSAKPATLVGDPKIEALSEGTIFHVQTYGKNLMGSYASQLSRKQRWMISTFIKSKQTGGKGATDSTAAAAPKGDTTKPTTTPRP